MARHGKRVSRTFCRKLDEALKDEKQGSAFYHRMSRMGKKEGLSHSDYWKFLQARRDEKKHHKWALNLKRKYCGR